MKKPRVIKSDLIVSQSVGMQSKHTEIRKTVF